MWRGAAASICSKFRSSPRAVSSSKVFSPRIVNGNILSTEFSSGAVDSPVQPSFLPSERLLRAGDVARHYGRCYWELSKAKLSLLVVATSGAGFVLGSGRAVDLVGLCCTCAGTMAVAAAANSLNQVFEVENDAKMKRTRNRPLPSGRLSVPHAVAWASSAGLAGTLLLAAKTNGLAAGLAASNLALYAFVYTPLKQIHPSNTWVGAVVGAIPPLLGWVAATGEISAEGMILPAALYFWQIPHFMALAYFCRNDYAAGGFKMFSLFDPSGWRTSLVSLRNSLYLFPVGYLAYDWGLASGWFAAESVILTGGMAAAAALFAVERTQSKAQRMFHTSLLYLPIFMSALLLHRQPHSETLDDDLDARLHIHNDDHDDESEDGHHCARKMKILPPVAYASAAPFPFLPVPLYATSEF